MATLTRMYQRRGTADQWADVATTVILQAGEIGLETDTGKFKIGNGVASWSALSYYLKDTDNAGLYAKLAPVGPSYSQNITGINVFTPQSASQTPIVVSGVSGQSAVLQRWRDNTDTTLASIDQTGKITAKGGLFNAQVDMNFHKIVNLPAPTNAADATNKQYVDDAIAGLAWKEAVHLIATTNVTTVVSGGTTGTLVIDGHTALDSADNGYRLLLTAQTTTSQNGIYVYNDSGSGTYTLTRSTDADNPAELVGASVYVQEGTTYGTSSWVQSNHYMTSFDQQTWVQFSGAALVTAGTGMTKTGNTLDVVGTANRITANADSIDIASTYAGQSTITTLGTIATGTWDATPISTTKGGIPTGGTTGQVLAKIDGTAYNTQWVTPSGGSASNSFATIATPSGTSPVADSSADTLTLLAGSGITITGDATADSVTIASTVTAPNTFGTIAVAGQSSVVADSTADTLTLVAGSNVTLTTNATTDTVTIAATGGGTSRALNADLQPIHMSYLSSGSWFTPWGVGGNASPIDYNFQKFVPLYIDVTTTFNAIGVNVVVASTAASTIKLAIYDVTASFKPGTLIVNAGTINGAVTGGQNIAINTTLTPGWYLLSYRANGTGTAPMISYYASPTTPFFNAGSNTTQTATNNWYQFLNYSNEFVSNPTVSGVQDTLIARGIQLRVA